MTAWQQRRRPGRQKSITTPRGLSLALLMVPLFAGMLAVVAPREATARTAELTHRVRAGESASAIARDYYGDLAAGELVLLYNGNTGTVIRAGDTLKIPYTAVHKVKAGDAWSAIAQKYLGRPSAYPTIARLNGLVPGQPLRIGARILIPAVLPYQLQRGESLSLLADRFYDDHKLGAVLQQFNEISDPRRLSPGQALQIPVVSLVLLKDRQSAPERTAPQSVSASKTEPTPPPPPAVTKSAPEPRFTRQLGVAQRAFRRGDYTVARTSLEALRQRIAAEGTPEDKSELWRQLTFVYVAFELTDETCTAYGRLRRSAPDTSFDPDLVSVKIRRAVSACAAG